MVYILSVFAVFIASISQLLLKGSSREDYKSFFREYVNMKVMLGYSLMGISLLINIYAMHLGLTIKELSVIESLNYLVIPVLSYIVFRESVNIKQILAIVLIVVGMIIFFQ